MLLDYCPIIKQRQGGNCRGHDLEDTEIESERWVDEACEECRCFEGDYVKTGSAVPFEHAGCHRVTSCDYALEVATIDFDGISIQCPFTGGSIQIPGYDGALHCPIGDIL